MDADTEYKELSNALQKGITQLVSIRPTEKQPFKLLIEIKVNELLDTTLVSLLMDKGVFTKEEYFTQLNKVMREEIKQYEALLTSFQPDGTKVKLL